MEYHDVISDCASISLDVIEGSLEGLRGKGQNINGVPRRLGNFSTQSNLTLYPVLCFFLFYSLLIHIHLNSCFSNGLK